MNTIHKVIKIDLANYWHVGSGQGAGNYVDSVCLKDSVGLPYLGGKQLKGLLRHAVHRAEEWGWYDELEKPQGLDSSYEQLLFGSRSQDDSRHETTTGMLFVDNAQLKQLEADFLQQDEQADLRQYLYQSIYQTKIDNDTGTAADSSLRGMEVCLPVQLYAKIHIMTTALDDKLRAQQEILLQNNPEEIIKLALPLVDAIGAYRSRGLGEAVLTLVNETEQA